MTQRSFSGIAAIMLVVVMLSFNVYFAFAANTVDTTAPNITGVSISSPTSIITSGSKISFDVIVEDESGVETLFLAFRPVDPGDGSLNIQLYRL